MDGLRRALGRIQKQLTQLGASHKLLIASLAILMVMALFLVSQYAGSPKMVELLAGAPQDTQAKAQATLDAAGIRTTTKDGKLMVPQEKYLRALSLLAEAGRLPEDNTVTFRNYFERLDWMNSKSVNDQIYNTALENTLAAVLTNFRGIENATVIIDAPPPTGLGAAHRKPTASVVVFTSGGTKLERRTVDAIASLVASSRSGLVRELVTVTDGTTGEAYTAKGQDDFEASTYMEHVAKIESYVQGKIADHLRYIRGVSVAVNAQVDVRRTTSHSKEIKPKGDGSETLMKSEGEKKSANSTGDAGSEPGLRANTSEDINHSDGGGTGSTTSNTDTEFDTAFGSEENSTIDPRGMATKINATIGIPWEHIVALVRQKKGDPKLDVPEADVQAAFAEERKRIEEAVTPLIETDAAGGARPGVPMSAGRVVVSLIPVPLALAGGVGGEGSNATVGGGFLNTVSTIAAGGVIKQLLLGGLAVVALGMMFMLARKAGKTTALPTAEELVGLPPALTANTDLVGEADETDTAMLGIEVNDDSLKTKKMLEEVADLVKANPGTAASLFNRWVTTDT